MSSEKKNESTSSVNTRKIANVMKVCLQKGKNTNYNCEKFKYSVEEFTEKYGKPLNLSEKKLQDTNALMQYVPLPWMNYFEKVLNSRDARHPLVQDNVDVFRRKKTMNKQTINDIFFQCGQSYCYNNNNLRNGSMLTGGTFFYFVFCFQFMIFH
ncbi:hypothetical protein L9F63_024488 [Diploptera punctata]|uniref:Uncharacterized protein n=1 Tax=Diploptera punctata TaxID=6984 RepID=A0AAD7ZFH2_DIPPU|nr:hypothetical protein L9F63_024488 [Diploptera punctata]